MNTRNAAAFIILVALTLLVAVCHPAQAHTRQERADWYTEWENRAMHAGYSEALLAELADFITRHTVQPSTGPGTPFPGPVEPVPYTASVEQWRTLVSSYFPADQVDRALRIMACESAGDPNAYNRSGASGLFQLMPIWYRGGTPYGPFDPFNPDANVAAAAWLWSVQGWAPWVCQ